MAPFTRFKPSSNPASAAASSTSTSVQTPALRSIGNIVIGNDLQTQVVNSALPPLFAEGIRKETCGPTAGSPDQSQAVIDANIVPPVINILQNADFKTNTEACLAISNATPGGLFEPSQIWYLISQGCTKPLCDLLQTVDSRIIQVALDGLDNILKVGEMDKETAGPGAVNQYALFVEEAGVVEGGGLIMMKIHQLQRDDDSEITRRHTLTWMCTSL